MYVYYLYIYIYIEISSMCKSIEIHDKGRSNLRGLVSRGSRMDTGAEGEPQVI